jgi:hypothetical protein
MYAEHGLCEETRDECRPILLDELVVDTDCEGCNRYVCLDCGQDVDLEQLTEETTK